MDDAQPTDHDLLRDFNASGSDEAFGRLVARHGGFVRAIARRRVRGDHHLAEDVTQAVFIVLTRRAGHASRSASLRGWLHATTCYAAANALRADDRRARRESTVAPRTPEASIADDPAALAASADEWAAIDAALCGLRSADRDALMLHDVDGRPLADLAAAIGTTPDGAKKRVQRARERLRTLIQRRGSPASIAERLPALALIPAIQDAPVLAGGAGGRAFVIAKKVGMAMKLQTVKAAAAIALASAAAIGGVAVVVAQPDRVPDPVMTNGPTPQVIAAPIVGTLSDDVRIELVGVFPNADPEHGWRPDGTPATQPLSPFNRPISGKEPPAKPGDVKRVGVVFRITHQRPVDQLGLELSVVPYSMLWNGHTEGTMTATLPPSNPSTAPTTQPTSNPTARETYYTVQLAALEYLSNCDLRLSIAPRDEPWQTIEAIGADGETIGDPWTMRLWNDDRARGRNTDRLGLYVDWATPVERDGDASVEVFDDLDDRERIVIAVDRQGREHVPAPAEITRKVVTSPTTTATVVQTQLKRRPYQQVDDVRHYATRARFPGLTLAEVDRFELRMRRRPALLFSEVALSPDAQTNVRVGVADPPVFSRDQPPPPADSAIAGTIRFNGERLDEAVAKIAEASGTRVYVHWQWLTQLQRGGPEHSVPPTTLTRPTPEIALRAVFAAASFDDIGVVVSDDGKTIRVLSSDRMVGGDGRAWRPGRTR